MVTVSLEIIYSSDNVNETMDETTDGSMDGSMNENMDGTTDGSMDGTMTRKVSVIFSADLGDVDSLVVIGNISAIVSEEQVGIATGNKYQVSLDGMRSTRFDLRDSAMTVS